MAEAGSEFVRVQVNAGVGHLTLTRERALNALDLGMVRTIRAALERWRNDPAVTTVVLDSASARAFCAGGDMRAIRAAVLAGDLDTPAAFFTDEYALNLAIAEYPKPYLALIDGHCLGGGMGISVHGQYRVVTEGAQLAMPETAIGLFPDVGASYFLSRLPGELGRFLALTGARLSGSQARQVGLATHFVSSDVLPDLRAALLSGAPVDDTLARFSSPPPNDGLLVRLPAIDNCLAGADVAHARSALAALDQRWADEAAEALAAASPSSLELTDRLLESSRGEDLKRCLDRDLRLARWMVQTPDFLEGVRALLIDRDHRPTWTGSEREVQAGSALIAG
jgi:enoyl-CoA hydratase